MNNIVPADHWIYWRSSSINTAIESRSTQWTRDYASRGKNPDQEMRCAQGMKRQTASAMTLFLCSILFLSSVEATANWPEWRGPFFNGMARGDAPTALTDKNIKWKIEIPGRGHSTPVVWGDKIFLTTAIPVGEAVQSPGAAQPGSGQRRDADRAPACSGSARPYLPGARRAPGRRAMERPATARNMYGFSDRDGQLPSCWATLPSPPGC